MFDTYSSTLNKKEVNSLENIASFCQNNGLDLAEARTMGEIEFLVVPTFGWPYF